MPFMKLDDRNKFTCHFSSLSCSFLLVLPRMEFTAHGFVVTFHLTPNQLATCFHAARDNCRICISVLVVKVGMKIAAHLSANVKPWRVKMHLQMRAGRKEHKNNGHHHSVSFAFELDKN